MGRSQLRSRKSKMAAKNQDGGQKFWVLWTKKLSMVLKNYHAKNGACCHSVTGHSTTAYTSGNKALMSVLTRQRGRRA